MLSDLCRCIVDIYKAEIVLAVIETYIVGRSPINPTPHPYLRFTWIHTLGHVGFGKRCEGNTV